MILEEDVIVIVVGQIQVHVELMMDLAVGDAVVVVHQRQHQHLVILNRSLWLKMDNRVVLPQFQEKTKIVLLQLWVSVVSEVKTNIICSEEASLLQWIYQAVKIKLTAIYIL